MLVPSESIAVDKEPNKFLTLKEAGERFNKTTSNISYLIQYHRINKYNSRGVKIDKARSGDLRVSLNELKMYFHAQEEIINQTKEQLGEFKEELAFFYIPERVRTKHVHRLHPYLGKFIPQLVEFYLSRAFSKGNFILDPFVGSGTTLVEANVLGLNSIGIDISEFNCMISRAKTQNYNLPKVRKELLDIYRKVEKFSHKEFGLEKQKKPSLEDFPKNNSKDVKEISFPLFKSDYLLEWFPIRSLSEISYYKSLIPNYEYQDLLKVVLCRSARSVRLTFHFELTRPTASVKEPYYCHKHKGNICAPIQTTLKHLQKYTKDTIRRIEEFSKIRTEAKTTLFTGDSRTVDLESIYEFSGKFDGLFTSPPYVGVLDYHEQHRYAYGILGLPWQAESEIGPGIKGSSKKAQKEYKEGIIEVFRNLSGFLKPTAKAFIVANDKFDLYPEIAEKSDFTIINRDERPVTKKASRERSFYSESIFELRKN